MLHRTSARAGEDDVGIDGVDECIDVDKWKVGHRGWVSSRLSLKVVRFDVVCCVVASDGNDGCIGFPDNIAACGSREKRAFRSVWVIR